MTDTHGVVPAADIVTPGSRMHPLVEEILKRNPNAETLREVVALQRESEKEAAKKAYYSALVALREALPTTLARDKKVYFNSEYKYSHTTLAAAMEAVQPILCEFGFGMTWKTAAPTKPGYVAVAAVLTHRAGHQEENFMEAPPDGSGSKSGPQAVASTTTMLQRYAALAMLGIVTRDIDEPQGNGGKADENAIDSKANLKLMGDIKKKGKTLAEAEGHVGRNIKEWTARDGEKLRAWIAGAAAGAHVEPVVKTMQGMVQKRSQRGKLYVVVINDVEYVTEDQETAKKCIGEIVIEYGHGNRITGVKTGPEEGDK